MLAYSPFISRGAVVRAHHVVVLEERGDELCILPTTSLDASAMRASRVQGEVGSADRAQAGWDVRCRFAVDALQWVPRSWVDVRPGARLTSQTMQLLRQGARSVPAVPHYNDADRERFALRAAPQGKERIAA